MFAIFKKKIRKEWENPIKTLVKYEFKWYGLGEKPHLINAYLVS